MLSDPVIIAGVVAISTCITAYLSRANAVKLDDIHVLVDGRLTATLNELAAVKRALKIEEDKPKVGDIGK